MSAPKLTEMPAETLPVQPILKEVSRRIVGQDAMVERLLVGLLTGGHILLEGVPGLAKTLAVRTLAEIIHASFSRIQFTPDLLPADLIGTMVFNQKTQEFHVKKGPLFAQIILADEINRAPAKVQAALLEAMQEHQVTIGGTTFPLDEPFMVLATQNPIENEGTYPLPEAQLDRFMLKVRVGYPSRDEEKEVLLRMSGGQEIPVERLLAARAPSSRPAPRSPTCTWIRRWWTTSWTWSARPGIPAASGCSSSSRWSPSAARPAPPSRWRRPRGPTRSSAGAPTWFPRTSARSPPMCSATASSSPSRPRPRTSTTDDVVARVLGAVRVP